MTDPVRTLVIGAGGHARVVMSLMGSDSGIEIAGVLDRTADLVGKHFGPTEIVGTFDDLSEWQARGISHVALALGNNRERAKWFEHARKGGFEVLSLCHPSVVIDATARLGRGVTLCAGAILCVESEIGDGAIINTGAIIDHESKVGSFAHISPGCSLAGRVTVGDFAQIGIGSSVKEKIEIGAGCIVGAGSVVVTDIPKNAVAYGVPAKVQRYV